MPPDISPTQAARFFSSFSRFIQQTVDYTVPQGTKLSLMLPFGKLMDGKGTQSQVMSQLMRGLEQAGCEVTRTGSDRLDVRVPSWESSLFSSEMVLPIQRYFWDHMAVTVDENGGAHYRLTYFGGAQLFLHLLVLAAFAFEAWFGASSAMDPMRFFSYFVCAQILPVILTLASFGYSRRVVLKKAFA